jgi:NAD(P)-dependent dehydrogenase (short-subunit alcohol dehydrogenase family)
MTANGDLDWLLGGMTEKKVWFITGAGRGLGTDIAREALAAGRRVVATGRRPVETDQRRGTWLDP